jgi:hypothetical protein
MTTKEAVEIVAGVPKVTQAVETALAAFPGAEVQDGADFVGERPIPNFEPEYEPFEEAAAVTAPAAPAPAPAPTGAGGITDPQVRKVSVMLSNLGVTNETDRHETAGAIIARPIDSIKELTKKEASTLIDSLGKLTADDFEETSDGHIRLSGSF